MPKQFTILVCGVAAVGHMNALAGATRPLIVRGHKVIFLLEEAFRGRFGPLGYIEHLYRGPKSGGGDENGPEEKPGERLAKTMVKTRLIGPESPRQKMANLIAYYESTDIEANMTYLNGAIEEAIARYKPDLIWYDANCFMPAVYYSGIPWVRNISMTPQFCVQDEGVPPGGSGLPTNDRTGWADFETIRTGFFTSAPYNNFIQRLGYPRFPDDARTPEGQIFTVYAYPAELDYPIIQTKGWFNLEVFNKPSSSLVALVKLVPKDFLESETGSGKLIFISMGSMGAVDLSLMTKLVTILGQTKHKYIVSKGPRHAEYSLPANMWGDRFLPQTEIISHCDLVITHGGNNTVCETFALGKPMVVLPLFADQFDNATRLEETGFGAQLDATHFTASQLIEAVDRLLFDEQLKAKLKVASRRISTSTRHEEMAAEVERLLGIC